MKVMKRTVCLHLTAGFEHCEYWKCLPDIMSPAARIDTLHVHVFAFSLFDIQAVVPSSHLYLPCRAGWNNGKALGLCSRAIQLF